MSERVVDLQPDVDSVIFGGMSDSAIIALGLKPRNVKRWGVDILLGRIPDGFDTLCRFQLTILLARREQLRGARMIKGVERQIAALCGE